MSGYKVLTADEASEILLESFDPVVVMHVRPDGDTVGTATALIRVLEALGKKAEYASVDDIPKRLEFIAKGLTRASFFEGRTVIAVDVASPKQAGDIFPALGEIALMIDHHEIGEPFAPNYIKKGASSAAEVLYDIILELEKRGKLTLTKEIAEPLFAAIASDTGSFRYSSASPSTFRVAARLLECGADHSAISHRLFSQKSEGQIRAEGHIAGKIVTACDGRLAYATHTKAEREALAAAEEDFECAIDVVRELMGVEIAAVIRETDKGEIKASLRSTGANVAEVARKFGGGGHVRAAGCSPSAASVDAAASMLAAELMKLL